MLLSPSAGDVADREQYALVGDTVPEARDDLENSGADQQRDHAAVHGLQAPWRLPGCRSFYTNRPRRVLSIEPGRPVRHLCSKISAYHVRQSTRVPRPGVSRPFPGYFPVIAIFPGFAGPEIPGCDTGGGPPSTTVNI